MPVGYSGHETGIAVVGRRGRAGRLHASSATSPSTARCGDPTRPRRWSRTASSRLVRDIRLVETAMGDGVKTVLRSRDPGHAEAAARRAVSDGDQGDRAGRRRGPDRRQGLAEGPAARSGSASRFADIMGVSLGAEGRACSSRWSPAKTVRCVDRDRREVRASPTCTSGCKDKARGAARLRRRDAASTLDEICFIGDDVNDVRRWRSAASRPRRPTPQPRRPLPTAAFVDGATRAATARSASWSTRLLAAVGQTTHAGRAAST